MKSSFNAHKYDDGAFSNTLKSSHTLLISLWSNPLITTKYANCRLHSEIIHVVYMGRIEKKVTIGTEQSEEPRQIERKYIKLHAVSI
jgi:hypothetical protein